ncbi:MAG: thioredoxin family protein [Ferruginibacter sp.]
MKKTLLITILAFISAVSFAQEKKLYDPTADAEKDIAAAVKKAKAEHKYVLLQGGGNWCSWCIEFARFTKADPQLDSAMNAGFIWYHLNYSKENKNEKTFAKYGYPQRFGYPVFIILNENGERINTQNSSYLEDGKKSYDQKKVLEFLEMWSPSALDPKNFTK